MTEQEETVVNLQREITCSPYDETLVNRGSYKGIWELK